MGNEQDMAADERATATEDTEGHKWNTGGPTTHATGSESDPAGRVKRGNVTDEDDVEGHRWNTGGPTDR